MKLANVAVNGGVRAASVKEDRLLLLDYDNLASVLAQGTPAELKEQTKSESLEQAFLALTGSSIRDESAGSVDQMRQFVKMWRR